MLARPALLIALAVPLAVPAHAATYSAKPVAPVAKRLTLRDISWSCGPAACQGATEYSRPDVLCRALVREAGALENFVVDGQALSPAELAHCNSAARTMPSASLARN